MRAPGIPQHWLSSAPVRRGKDRLGWPTPAAIAPDVDTALDWLQTGATNCSGLVLQLQLAPFRVLHEWAHHVQWSLYARRGDHLHYVFTLQSARWGSGAYPEADPGYPHGMWAALSVPVERSEAERAVRAAYEHGGAWGFDTHCGRVADAVAREVLSPACTADSIIRENRYNRAAILDRLASWVFDGRAGERPIERRIRAVIRHSLGRVAETQCCGAPTPTAFPQSR